MKYMKRFTNSMLGACAIALSALTMSMPAASAAEHPQAITLIASTPAVASAPAGLDVAIAATEQKALGAVSDMSGMPEPKPGAAHPLRASLFDLGSHAVTHRIHADREAVGRTSI